MNRLKSRSIICRRPNSNLPATMKMKALRMTPRYSLFRIRNKSPKWIRLSFKECWALGMTSQVKMQYKVQNPRISLKRSRIAIEVTLRESLTSAMKVAVDLIGKWNSLPRKSRSTTATTQRKIQAGATAIKGLPSSLTKINQKALRKKIGTKINRCSRSAAKPRTIYWKRSLISSHKESTNTSRL